MCAQRCSQNKKPLNTLFEVENVGETSYMDMVNHIELILALYELCPQGALLCIMRLDLSANAYVRGTACMHSVNVR